MKSKALKYLAAAFVLATLAACASGPQLAQGSTQRPSPNQYQEEMEAGGG